MSEDRATAATVDCITLRRDPTCTGSLGDIARVRNFLMSRCQLSLADAEAAINFSGRALLLRDQKISVVGVVTYRGRELAGAFEGAEELDPERLYRVLRSASALEHAARASGHVNLLFGHPAIDIDTATDAELAEFSIGEVDDLRFEAPFLRAPIIVERPDAIATIKTRRRSWSIGYDIFDLDMTPGNHAGEPYDGVICALAIHSVALVTASRAGLATRISLPKRS